LHYFRVGVTLRPLGIIFDFDGVIADTEPLHLQAFQRALGNGGLLLERETYYDRYLGFDDIGVFTALAADSGITLGQVALDELAKSKENHFFELLTTDNVLFPNARSCIEQLSSDFALGIASGALHHEIDLTLRQAGLQNYFTGIVAADDVERPKPAPDSYVRAVELLVNDLGQQEQSSPSRFVAIEDSQWGIDAAIAAGLPCIAITHTYSAKELAGADCVIADLSCIDYEFLENL